jgi:stress-induced-phosphoprotein 1
VTSPASFRTSLIRSPLRFLQDTDESPEVRANKKKALEEKELGNQLYKKREFAAALGHYNKAWELDQSGIVYLNNIAAVHFEAGDLDKCIETCLKAVEHGRDVRADFQLIAKCVVTSSAQFSPPETDSPVSRCARAYARAGAAATKKEEYERAVEFYGKSLAEHRVPEVLTKLRECEKLRDKKAKEAYVNPELADQAREKGNALFKDQKFADALASYQEATKRNPNDARNFSNRAAAYAKLMALPEALKDTEEAIRLDPKFSACPACPLRRVFHHFGGSIV